MTITVSQLEESEIPDFVRIEIEAFRSHPRIPMLWRRGYTEDVYDFYEAGKKESYHDPDGRLIKAVDNETGTIVAASEWTFALDPVKQANKNPIDPYGHPPANWLIDGNWELRRFFDLNLEKWIRDYLKDEPFISIYAFVLKAVMS